MSLKKERAFVLIGFKLPSNENCLDSVKKIDGVDFVSEVYGIYEALAIVGAGSLEELKERVYKIRRDDNVSSVLTLPITRGWERGNGGKIKEKNYRQS